LVEGFALYRSGVTYYGDENRPSNRVAGGAYFSSPERPARPGRRPHQRPQPGALRRRFDLRAAPGRHRQRPRHRARPGPLDPDPCRAPDPDLRAQAAALRLTGYYRPEDLDIDRGGEANGNARFCGNDTGNDDELLWGEAVWQDGTLAAATWTSSPTGASASPP
jgi:hypothetical protein